MTLDENGYVYRASSTVFATTTGSKYTMPKSVKATPKTITLEKKGTKKIKAKIVQKNKNGTLKKFRAVRFESSDPDCATVNAKTGKVTAKSAGKCYIYAYAQNGVYAKIKVAVK